MLCVCGKLTCEDDGANMGVIPGIVEAKGQLRICSASFQSPLQNLQEHLAQSSGMLENLAKLLLPALLTCQRGEGISSMWTIDGDLH